MDKRMEMNSKIKNEKNFVCIISNLLEMTSLIVPTIIGAKFGLTVEPESLKISIIYIETTLNPLAKLKIASTPTHEKGLRKDIENNRLQDDDCTLANLDKCFAFISPISSDMSYWAPL